MSTPPNKTLFQTFEWHTSSSPAWYDAHSATSHYARILRVLPSLSKLGITALWLPPGCKANNQDGNGYDCYDIWDLGEFPSKVVRSTKWGSREELADLIDAAHTHGMQVIWDAVLNHKIAGDDKEECWAVEVDPQDRRIETRQPKKIVPWVKYDFPGRAGKYSSFQWRAEHFNGTDWDDLEQKLAIYKLIDDPATLPKPTTSRQSSLQRLLDFSKTTREPPRRPGKGWAEDVAKTLGNHDYLLFCNIDHSHPAVRQDLINWGQWMLESTQVDGFRLDAVQHFSYGFSREWIGRMRAHQTERSVPPFIVGEVWTQDVWRITQWLDAVGQDTYAFDSPMLYGFSKLSEAVMNDDKSADLRRMASDSLVTVRPRSAVTVVANHDTQTGQASFTPMDARLKALFYAFILLRKDGYPCVFWGDLYGIEGPYSEGPACRLDNKSLLPDLVLARHLFAYGKQKDYFISSECIAWSRAGTHDRPGCVVVLSIAQSSDGLKAVRGIQVGNPGEIWTDILTADRSMEVTIDRRGRGCFSCRPQAVAVYVDKQCPEAKQFPIHFDIEQAK